MHKLRHRDCSNRAYGKVVITVKDEAPAAGANMTVDPSLSFRLSRRFLSCLTVMQTAMQMTYACNPMMKHGMKGTT